MSTHAHKPNPRYLNNNRSAGKDQYNYLFQQNINQNTTKSYRGYFLNDNWADYASSNKQNNQL
jgi:hypothetical protein